MLWSIDAGECVTGVKQNFSNVPLSIMSSKLFQEWSVLLIFLFTVSGTLEICSKFTGEEPCRSVISKKLLCNFIEVTLRHVRSLVNLLHISRTLSIITPLEDCFWKPFQWIVKLLSLCYFIQTEVCLGPRSIPVNTLQFTKCELHSKFYEVFFPNHSSLFSLIYSSFI